jgi:hypothetical protein
LRVLVFAQSVGEYGVGLGSRISEGIQSFVYAGRDLIVNRSATFWMALAAVLLLVMLLRWRR